MDSIVSHPSSRVRPGKGAGMLSSQGVFSLKEKKQRQDENSTSCFLQETCWGRIAPHRSAKNKAFKVLLRRTQGQKFLELLPAWVKEARGRKEVGCQVGVTLNPDSRSDPSRTWLPLEEKGDTAYWLTTNVSHLFFFMPHRIWLELFQGSENVTVRLTALGLDHSTLLCLFWGGPSFRSQFQNSLPFDVDTLLIMGGSKTGGK